MVVKNSKWFLYSAQVKNQCLPISWCTILGSIKILDDFRAHACLTRGPKCLLLPYVHWVLRMGASFWYWIYQAKWFMAPASSGSDSEKKDTCNEACPTLFNFSFTQCLTKTWESFGCWGWISREPRGENHHFTYKVCGRLHRLVSHCISSSYPTTRVNWAPGSLPLVWGHQIVGPSRQALAFK